jgi:hypothetical protein
MADAADEIDIDDEEGMDPVEYLGSLLQTEEGEPLAEVVKTIARHLENQNKLLIKLISAISQHKSS